MVSATVKRFACTHCDKTFTRSGHRSRHELIHNQHSPYQCSSCEKRFGRRDALQRHELTHQDPQPSALARGARACLQCATAKARCSGDPVCARCEQRRQDCVYRINDSENNVGIHSAPEHSDPWQREIQQRAPQEALPLAENATTFARQQSQFPGAYVDIATEADDWDGNGLSTINWLNILNEDFVVGTSDIDLSADLVPLYGNAPSYHIPTVNFSDSQAHGNVTVPRQIQVDIQSPISHISAVSASSGKTAADLYARQASPTSEPGEYYVDGEPARLPRIKRRKLTSQVTPDLSDHTSVTGFSLKSPFVTERHWEERIQVDQPSYENLRSAWRYTCAHSTFPWCAFDDAEFPDADVFGYLLGLYFKHFHQVVPMLHLPSFTTSATHWLLILAMSAIGANYLDAGSRGQCFATSLREFLRRCSVYIHENAAWMAPNGIVLARVRLLQFIGTIYSPNKQQTEHSLELRQKLTASCFDLVQELNNAVTTLEVDVELGDTEWMPWVHKESIRRTAYSIWLLDCMVAYQFGHRALLRLSDITVNLPCSEAQWAAETAQEWTFNSRNQQAPPDLQGALRNIYINKHVSRDLGEFARVIIVHGLYHRTWEVERYLENPLSQWEPSAKKQNSNMTQENEPIWLLSIPLYTKWQNSVCDCIDILHWQANATIGAARGIEHPTVAHLHLARVILLSPIQRIVRLARAMAGIERCDNTVFEDDKRKIHLWAVQGQYKARLAAIHAGVGFWHIRRHSIDAFYEAPAIALSALMLWAFAMFSAKQNFSQHADRTDATGATGLQTRSSYPSSSSRDADSEEPSCEIILLDRPTDDELVQQFVRVGHTMSAYMKGVGNLYEAGAPGRVLVEGCRLLRVLKCWGSQAPWLELLQRLVQVHHGEREKL